MYGTTSGEIKTDLLSKIMQNYLTIRLFIAQPTLIDNPTTFPQTLISSFQIFPINIRVKLQTSYHPAISRLRYCCKQETREPKLSDWNMFAKHCNKLKINSYLHDRHRHRNKGPQPLDPNIISQCAHHH